MAGNGPIFRGGRGMAMGLEPFPPAGAIPTVGNGSQSQMVDTCASFTDTPLVSTQPSAALPRSIPACQLSLDNYAI